MRFIASLAIGTVVAMASSHQPAAQNRQMGGIGLMVFSDSNYRGRNATFRTDVANLEPYELNDRISSLQVAPGESWEVCEHANYMGRCQVFSGHEPDLGRRGWSDTVSSVRRIRGTGPIVAPDSPPAAQVLELFSGFNFAGERRLISTATPDLGRLDFDNRAASLRLNGVGVWEVCEDTNFGSCRIVNTDWPDLARLEMSRQISSVRPWSAGGIVPPVGGGARLILYDERNFRGRALPVDGAMSSLPGFTNRAESLRVTGGIWQICERPSFAGRCFQMGQDIPDLGTLGMRNRVASVRPQ